MSPTVPPISGMTTGAGAPLSRPRATRPEAPPRPAELGEDDVRGRHLLGALDARLDLVRDVRDDLHGRAEELALALLPEHAVPHRARGGAAPAGRAPRGAH